MTKKTCWTAVTLLALAGCSAQEQDQSTVDVATPSEGARIINQNPSSPTVDVPNTPQNEAAAARTGDENADVSRATRTEPAAPTTDANADVSKATPAEPAPATRGGDANAPAVIENPSEPSPGVNDQGKAPE